MLGTYRLNMFDTNVSTGGPSISGTDRFWIFGFVATARSNNADTSGNGVIFDQPTRTQTSCYMRGLKERLHIETNNGHSWLWRRICFTFVGQEMLKSETTGATGTLWQDTTSGYHRAWTQLRPSANADTTQIFSQMVDLLFRGNIGDDWDDFITAKVDPLRVRLYSDKTIKLRSGNDNGVSRKINRWYPMNKTLIYNDDERGGRMAQTELSVNNRGSMGDYYVIDIFDYGVGTDPSGADQLVMRGDSSLYWHER